MAQPVCLLNTEVQQLEQFPDHNAICEFTKLMLLNERVSFVTMRKAWKAVIEHHPRLRTRFLPSGQGQWVGHVDDAEAAHILQSEHVILSADLKTLEEAIEEAMNLCVIPTDQPDVDHVQYASSVAPSSLPTITDDLSRACRQLMSGATSVVLPPAFDINGYAAAVREYAVAIPPRTSWGLAQWAELSANHRPLHLPLVSPASQKAALAAKPQCADRIMSRSAFFSNGPRIAILSKQLRVRRLAFFSLALLQATSELSNQSDGLLCLISHGRAIPKGLEGSKVVANLHRAVGCLACISFVRIHKEAVQPLHESVKVVSSELSAVSESGVHDYGCATNPSIWGARAVKAIELGQPWMYLNFISFSQPKEDPAAPPLLKQIETPKFTDSQHYSGSAPRLCCKVFVKEHPGDWEVNMQFDPAVYSPDTVQKACDLMAATLSSYGATARL